MKPKLFLLSLLIVLLFFVSGAYGECPVGSDWVSSWTDQFGYTTYTLEAPCKVYIGESFNVTATVTEANPYCQNNWVASFWGITDNGEVIAGCAACFNSLWVASGRWQTVIQRTYEGAPVDHQIIFKFTDHGQCDGFHHAQGSVIGNITVDPYPNLKPLAHAGTDQTVHLGSSVTLDGSGSSDPAALSLTYAWSFVSIPNGSQAVLSDPTAIGPTFTADLPGNYVVQLVVTNSQGAVSQPAIVTISTTNTAPVASAGPDQAVILIGSTIQFDGSQSYDPDGDPITYQWSFVSNPAGSLATLSNPNIVNPTFIADVHGTYIIRLIVSDPWTQSAPATVTVSFTNVAPVANSGTSQSAVVGDTLTLNGSGSSDANGDPLTYWWSFTSVPTGSQAYILSQTSKITTFVPDLPGTYVVQLIVNDGYVDSVPSTIQVQVVTVQTVAIKAAQDLETVVISLNPNVFKNANMQNALINKLNAVIANIEAGNYADALGQLQNDILGKTDGCATSGAPDKNDWIKDCKAQNQVYPLIMKAIELVRRLM